VNDIALSAVRLAKRYGARDAASNISFDLRRGRVLGFLGPNGAGKTTTIRMLVGLIRPTSGHVLVHGQDLQRHRERALGHIGCIVETPDLYPFLTGRENLEHFARMLDRSAVRGIDELASLVRMDRRLDEKVSNYSLGMRQRIGIAQALLGRPSILILDEPANGLDPAGMYEMRELIRRLATEDGLAVFLSSHLLTEMEKTCDDVVIIHEGKSVVAGTVKEVTKDGQVSLETVFLERTVPVGGHTL